MMSNDEFLPFSRPNINASDEAAVMEVLRSGWLTTGSKAREFEEGISRYTHAKEAVATASATGGMHCVLQALGLGPGDEVITPSMTWVSTINLICLMGVKPIFVDVDRETMLASAEEAEALITARTKALIPVHYAGAPVDLDAWRKLAQAHDVMLIEDAAHAIGTRFGEQPVGARGTAIFSFHPIKNMTTGEGGMVCSDDAGLVEKVRQLKFHGLGVDAFDRQQQGRSPQAEVLSPGYKYNLTDMAAALGLSQLARLDDFNERRRHLAGLYDAQLTNIEEVIPLAVPDYPHVHARHLMIVRLDTDKAGISRDDFMARLKEHGIGSGLHFRAVHQQKFYREHQPAPLNALPHTEWNSQRILSLPLFPAMKDEDVSRVVAAIQAVLMEAR